MVMSFTDIADAPFGMLDDQELLHFDLSSQAARPWLFSTTGAFFQGDDNKDGIHDDWNDVDALWVDPSAPGNGAYLSLVSDQGAFKDGDVFRLTATGGTEIVVLEGRFVTLLGCVDGNLDIDGLHVSPDGTWWLSLAEDEESTVLSSDKPGFITDGSILTWNSLNDQVGIFLNEQEVSALVTQILSRSVQIGDVLSLAVDEHQSLCFSVQSPTDHDGSVFSLYNGGTLLVPESALGMNGEVELDAVSMIQGGGEFLATKAATRTVGAGQSVAVELYGRPAQPYALLLSSSKGDAAATPFGGFLGLLISPTDPLFQLSVSSGAAWLWGVLDGEGRGTIQSTAIPPGITVDLMIQPLDLSTLELGTPGIVHVRS